MIFADIRLPGVMDGVDLAREVKMRWPHLTVILTSGDPGERLHHLPPGVQYMPKPWQPLNVLMVAERARLAARRCDASRSGTGYCWGASSDNGAPPLPLPPLSRRPGRAGRRSGGAVTRL